MLSCGKLVVGSPLTFSNFNFAYTSNFGPGVYDLIQSNSPLDNVLDGGTGGSVDGYAANLALSGNDVVLVVVPEPSTLALLAAAAVGLLAWNQPQTKMVSRQAEGQRKEERKMTEEERKRKT